MLGSIGLPELTVVLALVLIVFGAGKLPDVMSSMGKGVREFRKASEGSDEAAKPAADVSAASAAPPAPAPMPAPVPPPPSDAKPE